MLDKSIIYNLALTNSCNEFISILSEEDFLKNIEYAKFLLPETNKLVTVSIKDVFSTKGILTTAGSKVLQNYIPPFDATLVTKLISAGYVILGKNNCDAFAQGVSGENSDFGPTHNPLRRGYISGGSSSGSAASVAIGSSEISIGSDTGGSIRYPASMCGVIGLKPTWGSISRHGLIALASSLDCPGVFSKSIDGCESAFYSLTGSDPMDMTSKDNSLLNKFKPINFKRKIGILHEMDAKKAHPDVYKNFQSVLIKLDELGFEIVEKSYPVIEASVACYYTIVPAEASSNLSRFQGILFGYHEDADTIDESVIQSRSNSFGDENLRRIISGTFSLSQGAAQDYYLKACKLRNSITASLTEFLHEVDFIISPTTPTPAYPIGDKSKSVLDYYLEDLFTTPASLAGLPAISVPMGVSKDGLPTGLQIIGNHFHEHEIFSLAKMLNV